jgi:hypothetical protein
VKFYFLTADFSLARRSWERASPHQDTNLGGVPMKIIRKLLTPPLIKRAM